MATSIPHNSSGPDSSIEHRYRALTASSAEFAERADGLFPSGVTHDSRYLWPYGVYVERAEGAYKWDVDGNRYVDYFGGHGALLLGHSHPQVLSETTQALSLGTHFGANHQIEIEWAEIVKRLVPGAERVRFTSSGTEATQMAIRLARAATGKQRVMRFQGHFHGWHDEVTTGFQSHFDGSAPSGVLPAVAGSAIVLAPGDIDAVRETLERDHDVAAIIVEPLGSATGMIPLTKRFLEGLRELTRAHGVLLIFDEVVTGFRISSGGVQAHYAITPDITALAKILAGGMPGGAVVAREDLMAPLDFEAAKRRDIEKIYHPGTFNANPVSAAAGRSALRIIESSDACQKAATMADRLRVAIREVLVQTDTPWGVYGQWSVVHLFTNPGAKVDVDPASFDPLSISGEALKAKSATVMNRLRLAMLINGVDTGGWPIGLVSSAHDEQAIDHTVEAFRESLDMLRAESLLS